MTTGPVGGGGGSSNGTYYFDGADWTKDNDYPIGKFYFLSKSDGWACGLSSIYRWDGTEWTINFSDSSVWFQDIYFNAPDDGWAIADVSSGITGKHFHYDGNEWTRITDPIIKNEPLDAIHFVDSNWGWAINEHTYYYNGDKWTPYEYDSEWGKADIFCVNKNDVWMSMESHEYFLHFTGF